MREHFVVGWLMLSTTCPMQAFAQFAGRPRADETNRPAGGDVMPASSDTASKAESSVRFRDPTERRRAATGRPRPPQPQQAAPVPPAAAAAYERGLALEGNDPAAAIVAFAEAARIKRDYAEALQHMRDCSRTLNDDESVTYCEARLMLIGEQPDQSCWRFDTLIEKNPNSSPVVFYERATLCLGVEDRWAGAIMRDSQLVKSIPAMRTKGRGDLDRAIELASAPGAAILKKARRDAGKSVAIDASAAPLDEMYLSRAHAFVGLGNQAKALADFNAAIKLNSDNWLARQGHGFVSVQTGDGKSALSDFDAVLRVRPDDGASLAGHAWAQLRCEKWALATDEWNALAAKFPASAAQAKAGRAVAEAALGQDAAARADRDAALAGGGHHAMALVAMADQQCRRGKLDDAMANYIAALRMDPSWSSAVKTATEAVLKTNPNLAAARHAHGLAALHSKNYAAASDDFALAQKAGAKDAAFLTDAGDCWTAAGNFANARRDYEAAIAADAKLPAPRVGRIQALFNSDEYALTISEGSAYLQKFTVAELPVRHLIAAAAYHTRDFPETLKQVASCLNSNPRDAEAYYLKALAEEATGDFRAATNDCKQANVIVIMHEPRYIAAYDRMLGERFYDPGAQQLKELKAFVAVVATMSIGVVIVADVVGATANVGSAASSSSDFGQIPSGRRDAMGYMLDMNGRIMIGN